MSNAVFVRVYGLPELPPGVRIGLANDLRDAFGESVDHSSDKAPIQIYMERPDKLDKAINPEPIVRIEVGGFNYKLARSGFDGKLQAVLSAVQNTVSSHNGERPHIECELQLPDSWESRFFRVRSG